MPGTRAPHYWLRRGDQQISTLDLCGRHFALLAARGGTAWCDEARDTARQLGLGLDVFLVGAGGLHDPDDGFAAAYDIEQTGSVLVRPDGFVAWRARDDRAAGAAVLSNALRAILCRAVNRVVPTLMSSPVRTPMRTPMPTIGVLSAPLP
jgi:putative polyketide hydroxylase